MGWRVERLQELGPSAFVLTGDRIGDGKWNREAVFKDEADSHAAGEAIRLYLKRPRVSEIQAAKEAVERELNAARSALADARRLHSAEASALKERADEMEAGLFEKERLAAFQALHAEKQLTARLKLELQAAKERAENEGKR